MLTRSFCLVACSLAIAPAAIPQSVGAWTSQETAKLSASDGEAGDLLGDALCVDGDTALAGAYRSAPNNGGSVYVFDRIGGVWTEVDKLMASDAVPSSTVAGDRFGESVALEGDMLVVGAGRSDRANPDGGAAYVFELSFPPTAYCTAGTGVNGAQAATWGNGTSLQCVTPPLVRAGLLAGSGTPGTCNGSFTQDLNTVWTQKPAKNPGAGAFVQAQLWYRDPASTSNQTTGLSDAIEFYTAP